MTKRALLPAAAAFAMVALAGAQAVAAGPAGPGAWTDVMAAAAQWKAAVAYDPLTGTEIGRASCRERV